MILLDEIVEVLATPHLNILPLRVLPPQKPKGQVALLSKIDQLKFQVEKRVDA
jgi:hypothetical protein